MENIDLKWLIFFSITKVGNTESRMESLVKQEDIGSCKPNGFGHFGNKCIL